MSVHIAILFTMMLRHGLLPDGMLFWSLGPIPKGWWGKPSNLDNFRGITLSSILWKILDVVILTKERENLCSSNLQFSFKPGASTSLCTSMVQETISYINNGFNVYGLMLDDHSSYVNVSNGVKQGGVISPILFCIYIDGLLVELEKCGVGWFMLMTSNCCLPLFKHCIFWLIYVLNMLLNMIFCLMGKIFC